MNLKYQLTKQVKEFIYNAILSEMGIGCSNSQSVKIKKIVILSI